MFMASYLCPCRRPVTVAELWLDAPVLVVVAVSPVAAPVVNEPAVAVAERLRAVAVAAVARPRVRPAAVAASLDALRARLAVAVQGPAAQRVAVRVVQLAVVRVALLAVARVPVSAAPAQRAVLHVAPHRDLSARPVVVELEPALSLPVARPDPDVEPGVRRAPGASVPSHDRAPGSHASTSPNQAGIAALLALCSSPRVCRGAFWQFPEECRFFHDPRLN